MQDKTPKVTITLIPFNVVVENVPGDLAKQIGEKMEEVFKDFEVHFRPE